MLNKIFEYLKTGVFLNNKVSSFSKVYSIMYSLTDRGGENTYKLFDYYKKTILNYILECKNKLKEENKINLIDKFLENIRKINFLIYWMTRIFIYYERYNPTKKLSQVAINLCKLNLFDEIKKDIFTEVEKLINEDRNGNKESRLKIKNVMNTLKIFDFKYPIILKENNKIIWAIDEKQLKNEPDKNTIEQDLWFEEYFIKDTKKYLEVKVNKDFFNMPLSEYILSQITFIEEENERLIEYINPKYHNDIKELEYQYLIVNALKEYGSVEIYIKNLLESEDYEQLINLSRLTRLIPKDLDPISHVFDSYIKSKYEEKFNNKELLNNQIRFVSEVIKFKKEIEAFIQAHFKNITYFNNLKDKALNLLFRKESFAKKLSIYIDYCMRSGFKGKSNEEIENTLDNITQLFLYLNSKLVFQIELNKKMSERLLKNISLSINYEKKLISKLGQEAGLQYVSKIQKMFEDLEKSKINKELYKTLTHKGSPNDIKLNITVVSQNAWEINKNSMENIKIPKFLSVCLEDYENFYLNKYKNQKLIWCLGLSKIEIKYLYLDKKYISISTLSQLLILLLLEQKEELSLQNISELLGINNTTIINNIQGFVYNPSFNPLAYEDKGIIKGSFNEKIKELKENGKVFINKNFNCSKIKFSTIPLKQKKSDLEINEQELKDSQIIKRYQNNIIQSTITRIMKSRIGQETTHVWLMNETSKQIDLFKAQPHQIKENIEKLIEKNVIKRSDKIGSMYEYIA